MKRIGVKFKCPGDNLDTEIVFRRPPAIGHEIVQFKCSACGSHLLARVKRSTSNQITYQIKIVRPSGHLIAMLKEEQAIEAAAP